MCDGRWMMVDGGRENRSPNPSTVTSRITPGPYRISHLTSSIIHLTFPSMLTLALFALPSPLHPAVVHFPIVLLLLGEVVALPAALFRRWQLPTITAVLFGLGALGAVVAVQTGESEGDRVVETPALEAVLEEHEEWAERAQVAALIVAALACGAAALGRWPGVARGFGVLTVVGGLAVGWCVVETGHYGGQLVYRHGAGVAAGPVTGRMSERPSSEAGEYEGGTH